jgi:hypothetical protein
MQIVEKQGQGMLDSSEYSNESSEQQLETALRILWRKLRHWGLFSYN